MWFSHFFPLAEAQFRGSLVKFHDEVLALLATLILREFGVCSLAEEGEFSSFPGCRDAEALG